MAALVYLVNEITIEMSGDIKRYLVTAKQGDKGTRFIVAKLLNNGKEYIIPEDARTVVHVKKPDNKKVYNTCTHSGSEVTIELTEQILAATGTAYCDIEIRTSDGSQVITSAAFELEISKSMRDDSEIESSHEFTELQKLIAEASTLAAKLSEVEDARNINGVQYGSLGLGIRTEFSKKASKNELQVERARIDALTKLKEGSTTGDAELQDIRIGHDGTSYENAGAAVRGQIGQLSNEIDVISSDVIIEKESAYIGTYGLPVSGASGISYSVAIPVIEGTIIKIMGYCKLSMLATKDIFFFSDEKLSQAGLIAQYYFNDGTQVNDTDINYNITVPEGAKYVRINIGSTSTYKISHYINDIIDKIKSVDFDALPSVVSTSELLKGYFFRDSDLELDFSAGYHINNANKTYNADSSSGFYTSNPFQLYKGETIEFYSTSYNDYVMMIVLCDEDGNVNLATDDHVSSGDSSYKKYSYTAQEDVFVKITGVKTLVDTKNWKVYTQPITQANEVYTNDGDIIVNLGDSIFGAFRDDTSISNHLSRLTGANVHNCAMGGTRMTISVANGVVSDWSYFALPYIVDSIVSGNFSTQETILNENTSFPSYFKTVIKQLENIDFSAVDIVTISFGTNDYFDSVPLTTENVENYTRCFKTALSYSIEKLLTAFPNIRVLVSTPIWRGFKTDGVVTSDSTTRENLSGLKLIDYGEAIKEVAKNYNINVCDFHNEMGVSMFNWRSIFEESDLTHPNAYGRERMARKIAQKIIEM